MKEEKFQVEIITPTIIAGADSRNLDPLKIRPSEIKGMMRFAFRLIAGKYIDHRNEIKTLLEKESLIFGSTQKKSDFKLILHNTENLNTGNVKLLPHKSSSIKKAVLPNQKFELSLIYNKYSIDFYKSLLNLTFLIGVGNRRNRLFGNMQIENPLDLANSVKNIDEVCKSLFGRNELSIEEPLFPSFSKKSNGEKNYIVFSSPLKSPLDVENLLTKLYKEIIHTLEKDDKKKHLLGSTTPRQSSYINFSLQKHKDSYKLYFISYYYKNKDFDYQTWKEAVDLVKEKIEKIN